VSRLTSLSANAIRAMYGSETDQGLITLITIYDPITNVPAYRLADNYTGRLASVTTDQEIIYGVTSRSNEYSFLPMQITLPSENDTGLGQCNIVLNYALPEAIALIRSRLFKPTKVLIELVLSGSPNTVEVSFTDFSITSVGYSAQQITLNLEMVSLIREPFPCYNFTPGYFPGLF